jgi:hypothetical protein
MTDRPSFNHPQPISVINVTYNMHPGYCMPPPSGPVLSPVYPDVR